MSVANLFAWTPAKSFSVGSSNKIKRRKNSSRATSLAFIEPDDVVRELDSETVTRLQTHQLRKAKFPLILNLSHPKWQLDTLCSLSTCGIRPESVRTVAVTYNRLENLDGLDQFPRMEVIEAKGNEISSSTWIPLKKSTKILRLDLSYNVLTDVPHLTALNAVKVLDLSHNQISGSLKGLRLCPKLTVLRLGFNRFKWTQAEFSENVQMLTFFKYLEELSLEGNQFCRKVANYFPTIRQACHHLVVLDSVPVDVWRKEPSRTPRAPARNEFTDRRLSTASGLSGIAPATPEGVNHDARDSDGSSNEREEDDEGESYLTESAGNDDAVQVLEQGSFHRQADKDVHDWMSHTSGRGSTTKGFQEGTASSDRYHLPAIVWQSIQYLHSNALAVDGIFHEPRDIGSVDKVYSAFWKGKINSFRSCPDPHLIGAVLKRYFSQLASPLFPTDLYSEMISCYRKCENDLERRDVIHSIVVRLASENKRLLQALFSLLHTVSHQHEENGMTSSELSKIWAPLTLGKNAMIEGAFVRHQTDCFRITRTMIDDYRHIFQSDDDRGSREKGVRYAESSIMETPSTHRGWGHDQGERHGSPSERSEMTSHTLTSMLRTENDDATVAAIALKKEVHSLRKQLQQSQNELSTVVLDFADAKSDMQRKIDDLENENKDLKVKISQLEGIVSDGERGRVKLQATQINAERTIQERDAAEARVSELERKIMAMEGMLARSSQGEENDDESPLEDSIMRLQAAESELQYLREHVRHLESKREQQASPNSRDRVVSHLKAELASAAQREKDLQQKAKATEMSAYEAIGELQADLEDALQYRNSADKLQAIVQRMENRFGRLSPSPVRGQSRSPLREKNSPMARNPALDRVARTNHSMQIHSENSPRSTKKSPSYAWRP